MRISTLSSLLLPALTACHVIQSEPQPASAPLTAPIPTATASLSLLSNMQASMPTSVVPEQENLDLRQAPVAPPAPGAPNPGAINPNPVAPTTTAAAGPVGGVSLTVQWLETMLGNPQTKTWVPVTITVKFEAVPDQAPQPGIGQIGMGTLTGQPGVTKMVQVGAAPTRGAEVFKGFMVAAGVGLARLVV